ncbi:cytochrome P450 [Xylariaceae sp. FL1651]|nr:cytochrome P450 [Xylariaceae sp. FL1651]
MQETWVDRYSLLTAASLGFLSHIIIFIRGEWHMFGYLLVKTHAIVAFALLCAGCFYYEDFGVAAHATGSVICSYLVSLFISIAVYRTFFHRLRRFPGPRVASVTKLWHAWKCRNGNNHLLLEELARRYGPIIRTGPEELTIIDPAIVPLIDGPKSKCTKAAWYDIFLPQVAINTTRNSDDHSARRRVWDRGFGPTSITLYGQYAVQYADLMKAQIEDFIRQQSVHNHGHLEATINVTDWCAWFAFDVMGEFAFAKSFGMLHDRKWHDKIRLLIEGMAMIGPISPVPWLAQMMLAFRPRISPVKKWLSMLDWCKSCMGERLQNDAGRPDVSYWLIEEWRKGFPTSDKKWLDGDAVTMVVAGSGTVATTLTFALYELARAPARQVRLLTELKSVNIYDRLKLQSCTNLDAIIQETLRLHPPIPTGGYRVTPREGLFFKNVYIPGNTTIVAPSYSMGRLNSCYERSEQFLPERWTTRQDLVLDKRGFAPFSLGKFGCIGKTLAMIEIRIVLALIVKHFEIGFAEGEKGDSLFEGLQDQFTFAPGALNLNLRIRPKDNIRRIHAMGARTLLIVVLWRVSGTLSELTVSRDTSTRPAASM